MNMCLYNSAAAVLTGHDDGVVSLKQVCITNKMLPSSVHEYERCINSAKPCTPCHQQSQHGSTSKGD
jgi:hypothetical protein